MELEDCFQNFHGKPFWGECALVNCSIEKGHCHCGHCSKMPCDNEEHGDNGERLINLKNWA